MKASNDIWKTRLAGKLPDQLAEEIDTFETEIDLRSQDKLDEDGDPEFVAILGPRNVQRHASFFSLDFRVSRTWKLERGSLMAFLEVANLTNRRNECCFDFDIEEDEETGEEFFEQSFDYWLPLMPAIGILWEF